MNKVWLALGLLLLMGILTVGATLAQTPPDPVLGAKLYADNCQVCHGERGEGRVGARLRDFPAFSPSTSRNLIKDVVTNGISGSRMPAWKDTLKEDEIDAIVEYVVSWTSDQTITPPTATPQPIKILPTLPGVQGNPTQGQVVFQQNCQMCHGLTGEGRIGANLAKPFSSVFPQAYVLDVIEHGIDNTVMPGWNGVLSEEQIKNVAAYVLSFKPAPASSAAATPTPSSGNASFIGIAAVFALGLIVMIAVALISSRGPKE